MNYKTFFLKYSWALKLQHIIIIIIIIIIITFQFVLQVRKKWSCLSGNLPKSTEIIHHPQQPKSWDYSSPIGVLQVPL